MYLVYHRKATFLERTTLGARSISPALRREVAKTLVMSAAAPAPLRTAAFPFNQMCAHLYCMHHIVGHFFPQHEPLSLSGGLKEVRRHYGHAVTHGHEGNLALQTKATCLLEQCASFVLDQPNHVRSATG